MPTRPVSATSTSSYTRDVNYTSRFGVLQAPIHLTVAAGLRGWIGPDPSKPFTYVDLGCGNGHTLVTLAAAYPYSKFIGIDFNPEHLDMARARIREAALDNVSLIHSDLLNASEIDEFKFDYATIVGTYSWLDQERKTAARAFLERRANPAALALIDYAANPGSGASDLLYEMIRKKARSLDGNSSMRLAAAIHDLSQSTAQGAKFFSHYPTAKKRLQNILEGEIENEAHEVFNLNQSLWFDDLNADMHEADFSWANTARLTHAFPEFVLPMPSPLVERGADSEALQLDIDIALNTAYRADVFIKSGVERAGVIDALSDFHLNDVNGAAGHRLKALIEKAPWIDEKSSTAVLSEMTGNSSTVRSAGVAVRQQSGDPDQVVGRLIASSVVRPMPHEPIEASNLSGSTRWIIPSEYNRRVIEDDLGRLHPRPLASPVAGTGLILPLVDRLTIFALAGGDLSIAYQALEDANISTEQAFGSGFDNFSHVMSDLCERFKLTRVEELEGLGIIERKLGM